MIVYLLGAVLTVLLLDMLERPMLIYLLGAVLTMFLLAMLDL